MLQLMRKPFRGAVPSGNLRRFEMGREPKRGTEKNSRCVRIYFCMSYFRKKAFAHCSYAPTDCWKPPTYNRTGCNVI
jgi:hypothetical protein